MHDHDVLRTRTAKVRLLAQRDGTTTDRVEPLATEEPMEIRVVGLGGKPEPLVVTMRTPGDDFELAAGFLFTEGLVASAGEIESVDYCVGPDGVQEYNVVTVRLRREWDASLRRQFLSDASRGVCGRASIADAEVRSAPVSAGPLVSGTTLLSLVERLSEAQEGFAQTGGLQAAGLFDAGGALVSVKEDVGRHNALDKLIGEQFLAGAVPLDGGVVVASGRLSFEMVQKAAVAGVPILAAVSAPSSLAVDAARHFGMTLVGFLRPSGYNVYAGPERIASARAG